MTVTLPFPSPDAPFALLREMAAAVDVLRHFDPTVIAPWRQHLSTARRLLITGEGSSRIFPAKNTISLARRAGLDLVIETQGAREAAEQHLSASMIVALSNSGQTREAVTLAQQLPGRVFGITATAGSALTVAARDSIVLACGAEQAVAASKSVIEQALLLQALCLPETITAHNLTTAADAAATTLALDLPATAVTALAEASTIYVAGRNNGVAEEIALKSCEITRQRSLYLEGTYVLHGIEEVMRADDCVILVDPFETEIDRYQKVLCDGVGLTVIAIASFDTPFPTLRVPCVDGFNGYLQLMAGWRLLTAAGLTRGIDIDKTIRARKIGNAVEPITP